MLTECMYSIVIVCFVEIVNASSFFFLYTTYGWYPIVVFFCSFVCVACTIRGGRGWEDGGRLGLG